MQELDIIAQQLEGSIEKFKAVRRSALDAAGGKLLTAVRGRIGGSGRVQRWQEKRLGSGGGYVAVRAAADTSDEHGTPVGYLTNAIEGGHAVRKQTGNAKRWQASRATLERVPGKYMYRDTDPTQIAAEAANQIEREVAKYLEG